MDDELDFREYLFIVRKYFGWAILSFLVVFGAIIAYTYTTSPVYESKSLIVLTSQDQANFILGSSAPKAADIETQKIILQSPAVMESIYKKYGQNSFELTITNIKNSNIIEISVETDNPKNAVNIANGIAQSYINYTMDARRIDAENNIDFITGKIESYGSELDELDLELVYYKNNEKTLSRQERMEYQNIQREITAKTKIYDYLLTKREEAALTANMESANVKIIQSAEYPELPIKPNKSLNLALGFILALGAGAGIAILIDSMKPERKKRF